MVPVMAASAPLGSIFPPISAVSAFPVRDRFSPLAWWEQHALCLTGRSYRTNSSARSVRFLMVAGYFGGWREPGSSLINVAARHRGPSRETQELVQGILAAIVPEGFHVEASDGTLWYSADHGRFPVNCGTTGPEPQAPTRVSISGHTVRPPGNASARARTDPAAGGRVPHSRPFRGRARPAPAAGHLRKYRAHGLGQTPAARPV